MSKLDDTLEQLGTSRVEYTEFSQVDPESVKVVKQQIKDLMLELVSEVSVFSEGHQCELCKTEVLTKKIQDL